MADKEQGHKAESQSTPLLTPETVGMLVASLTQGGNKELSELEVERLLNALARVQAGVPTGPSKQRPE